MAIQTLRPNGTATVGGWTASSTTLHGDTSDDSTGTWAGDTGPVSGGAGAYMVLDLTAYTLAAGERVKQWRLRASARGDASVIARIGGTLDQEQTHTFDPDDDTLFLEHTPPWHVLDVVVSQAQITGATCRARVDRTGGLTRDLDIAELYFELDVWERTDTPTVATDPAGAGGPPPVITTTDIPTVESHTAALNDGLPGAWSRQVKVIRDAVYAGFATDDDITNETDVEWEDLNTSFGTPSTAAGEPDTIQVGTPLANNDTYKVFVRYGKNDVAGSTLWSLWGEYEFTLTLTLPTAPAVDVAVDQPNGRQVVEVTTAVLTHDTLDEIRVERSDDGATWATIRGGFITQEPDGDPLAPSTQYTFHDYDAPRATSLEYRARVTEGLTASGTTITSDWTTSPVVSHPNDEQVWLFDVPTFEHAGPVRVLTGVRREPTEQAGVFEPVGRRTAVVVTAGRSADRLSLLVWARGTSVPTVESLMTHTGRLLVKWANNTQDYVRVLGRTAEVLDLGGEPRRRWHIDAVEVDSGITADG